MHNPDPEPGSVDPATGLPAESEAERQKRRRRYLIAMSFTALGVVYGDIGTSPLYALRESFHSSHGVAVNPANIMGILSLIFWSLVLVISVKYLIFILRADNEGEGGILAVTALVSPIVASKTPKRGGLILLGLFGTALLYGDGMITPAISVLSAVEGLEIATPALSPFVIPVTIAILIALFLIQSHGTAAVGKVFGPVTLAWFIVIALLGIWHITQSPQVLGAMLPHHAILFLIHNGWHAFLVLGSVFLVVTGGEALYSDLGHLGKTPIRLAWFTVVLPALLLNYFGQGALLLQHPEAVVNPFYLMAPKPLLLPVVVIATAATVIASQALITGIFSLSMQATQLGYIPRVLIQHTSTKEAGQIYVSGINWMLLIACVSLVLGFRSSSNLAAAYGVAVTTTMVITTILFYMVARHKWNWSRWVAGSLCGFFLLIDIGFWAANLIKIPSGGWFPLIIGAIGFIIMTTWKTGRHLLAQRMRKKVILVPVFVSSIEEEPPTRVPGVGVFMSSNPIGTPPALLHSLEHFRVLHETVVLLSIETEEVPYVSADQRMESQHLGNSIYSVILHYGFMEKPDVPREITGLDLDGLKVDPGTATYFLGRENLIASRRPQGMAIWREKLFAIMSKNASSAANYFQLPPNRVVELGMHIEI